VVIWTLILTKMLCRRLKNTDEIGLNDIDDETPAASDDDDDVIWSRCGLWSIQNIGVHSSQERGVCFFAPTLQTRSHSFERTS